MVIEIWSDFSCPFCYIGKKKLKKALLRNNLENKVKIIYKAFELNPNASDVVKNIGVQAFLENKGGNIHQIKAMFASITNFAKEYGLNYNMDKITMTSTRKAHRISKWAKEFNKEEDLVEQFMHHYFVLGANLAENAQIIEIVKKINLDENAVLNILGSKQYDDEVAQDINEAQLLKISGVPYFLINGKFSISGAVADEKFDEILIKAYNDEKNNQNDDLSCKDDCAF